jgi:peptidoglycan/xylan/chitin deacetylase (PgdA/CDA1 family)
MATLSIKQHGALRKVLGTALRKAVGTITHVATQENVAALTFDDGPHPEFTPRLLEILAKYQAQATFFMVGLAAQRHPRVVQQVAQGGHTIGNHTWDHPSLLEISGRERRAQIQACAQAIAPYGQRILRPPYGHQNLASHLDSLWLRYKVVTWSLTPSDWLDQNGASMADWLISHIQPGCIILLHDGVCRPTTQVNLDRHATLIAVDLMLKRLGDWMHFVTLPELLQRGRPQRENWYRKGED